MWYALARAVQNGPEKYQKRHAKDTTHCCNARLPGPSRTVQKKMKKASNGRTHWCNTRLPGPPRTVQKGWKRHARGTRIDVIRACQGRQEWCRKGWKKACKGQNKRKDARVSIIFARIGASNCCRIIRFLIVSVGWCTKTIAIWPFHRCRILSVSYMRGFQSRSYIYIYIYIL